MGGGAAMKSAAKVAGMGLFSSGLRGGHTVVPPAEHNVLNVSRPASVILSSQGNKGSVDVGSVQRPSWELDDWEFAGGEEDLAMGTVVDPEPMARVVFGGVPSMNEAKEATNELKEALEKVYLSPPNATGCKDSVEVGRVSMPLVTNSGYVENESSIFSGTKSTPQHAVQAFKMLSESPAAQSVVTSLACDPNVWNAVMQNDALVGFLQAQKSCSGCQDQLSVMKYEELSYNGSQAGNTALSDNAIHDHDDACQAGNSRSGFEDFILNIKHTVVDMVNNVSVFFHNIFGSHSGENISPNADSKSSSFDKTLGTSLMGLAIMVIMVVLLKRV